MENAGDIHPHPCFIEVPKILGVFLNLDAARRTWRGFSAVLELVVDDVVSSATGLGMANIEGQAMDLTEIANEMVAAVVVVHSSHSCCLIRWDMAWLRYTQEIVLPE